MKLVLTTRAQLDIQSRQKAGQTLERIFDFLDNVLAKYPRTGRLDTSTMVFESWIPKTPLVVLYRVDDPSDCVVVLALFHHAQERPGEEDPG
jgi:plasmid stabilization system protein ParE